MTVFATPVLDNFNRANESPLSAAAGWIASQWQSTVNIANGTPSVVSNKMQPFETVGVAGGYTGSQVRSDVIAADVECYITLPATFAGGSRIYLMARADAPGVAAGAGRAYVAGFLINNSGFFNAWDLEAPTQASFLARPVGSPTGGGPIAGAKLGFRVYGSNPVFLEMWLNTGSGWVVQWRLTDSDPARITAAGRIGVYCVVNSNQASGQPLDDFGGGAITAPAYSINTDVFPGFTGGLRDRLAERASLQPAGRLAGPASARRDRLAELGWQTPSYVTPGPPGVVAGGAGGVSVYS